MVRAVASPQLGVCLDPGNCVARLETPDYVIAEVAPYVVNMHVKDFAFTRAEGWVGFSLTGCPLGAGLLDYDAMIRAVRPGAGDQPGRRALAATGGLDGGDLPGRAGVDQAQCRVPARAGRRGRLAASVADLHVRYNDSASAL